MKRAFTFLFVLYLSASILRPLSAQAEFVFTEYVCEGPQVLCANVIEVMQPKAWLREEKDQILSLTQDISKRLPHFMTEIQSRGPIRIARLTRGAIWDKGQNKFVPYPFFGEAGGGALVLTDQAFAKDMALKTKYNMTILEHVLLHELGHIFDSGYRYSYSERFTTLTHFNIGTDKYGNIFSSGPIIDGLDPAKIDQTNLEMRNLYGEGKYADGFDLAHHFGVQYGFPSVYAMTSPTECFPELIAWIYHDDQAGDYLSTDLFQYMNTLLLRAPSSSESILPEEAK